MKKTCALAALAALVASPAAHAVHLKELVFTGTIASGVDSLGGVFGPAPAFLTGLSATGRFVWDADKMTGVQAFGNAEYHYITPGWQHPYAGSVSEPFMSASLTVNGITRPIENFAPNPSFAPVRHSVSMGDAPGQPAFDFLGVSILSARFGIAAITDEHLQLVVAGVPGGILDGEGAAQNFSITVNSGNLNSYAIFRLNSGFTIGSTFIPNDPSYGNNDRHYAEGSMALSTVTLRDVPPVPEPASWALLAGGLAALRFRQRQARR